ncbi:hypothetical protein F1880_008676 [Penicillium rolfsii]|nr:hypothetical protein F1880_008676 [Penicillium rolfsii]
MKVNYNTFATNGWNYQSVILPKKMSSSYQKAICTVSPPNSLGNLDEKNAFDLCMNRFRRARRKSLRTQLLRIVAECYPISLHIMREVKLRLSSYLKNPSPDKARSCNTRINVLIRRFVG